MCYKQKCKVVSLNLAHPVYMTNNHFLLVLHCYGDFILYCVKDTLCLKNDPTLKRYSSKLYGSVLMVFGRNIQKTLE